LGLEKSLEIASEPMFYNNIEVLMKRDNWFFSKLFKWLRKDKKQNKE
jgi:hypothetical protein